MSAIGPFRDEYENAALLAAEPEMLEPGELEDEFESAFAARDEVEETWLQPEAESWETEDLVGNEGAALLAAEPEMLEPGEFEDEFESAFAVRDEVEETWLQPEAESWETEDLVGNEGAALLAAEPEMLEPGELEDEFESAFDARDEVEETWLQPEAESWEKEDLVGNEAAFEDELELVPPIAETVPMHEAESLFDEATYTIRRALEAVRTRARIAEGTRDESTLTNLVFFERHPEAAGRPLSKDNPHFEELRWEWLAIRDTIVRPALRHPAPTASYDREGALAYARKFWLRPCDDGFIALGGASGGTSVAVESETRFVHEPTPSPREHAVRPDGTEIQWEHLDDCTHFISCCIGQRPGERCGGLKITLKQLGEPPEAPYGIVRVNSMMHYLVAKGYARAVAEKTEDESAVGELTPGDLIAYFNKSREIYSHLAMLLPDSKIACHTYARSDQPECTWDNRWALGRGTHSWTFLQFA